MFWFILALLALPFGIAAVVGAPWVPALRIHSDAALDLLDLPPGATVIDLGSGDGRLLAAAARRGLRAIGYEINPLMWLISLAVALPYRRRVHIRLGDFWRAPLPLADGVVVFLIPRLMPRLAAKLATELPAGTPVASLAFEIPGIKPTATKNGVFLYLLRK